MLKKLIVGSGEGKYTSTSWWLQGYSGSDPKAGNWVKKAALCEVGQEQIKRGITES